MPQVKAAEKRPSDMPNMLTADAVLGADEVGLAARGAAIFIFTRPCIFSIENH